MSEPIRTLQLGKSWFTKSTGGSARVYDGLIRHLPKVGVHVEGLVINADSRKDVRVAAVHGVASESDPIFLRWRALRKMLRGGIDLERCDLVASHFALYTVPLLDLVKDRPMVIHFHGPWALESRAEGEHPLKVRLKGAVEKAVYRRGICLIVLSEAFQNVLVSTYGIPEERVRIVPGGVDFRRYDVGCSRREARERLGMPLDRPIVLAVRRLVRRMGLENLILAMKYVRSHIPDVLLLIAGKGPLAAELQARIEAETLGRNVRLLGYVPDEHLPFLYRSAQLSVVPTVTLEGFGLITLESLAAGTPVLVTNVGGLPEAVRALSDRLVLPDGSARTLGEYLTAALEGKVRLPSEEACQTYVRTRYDWPVIATQVRTVYEEVLSCR